MGKLTTHILDTSAGKPAAGVQIDLYEIEQSDSGEQKRGRRLNSAVTNHDGRCDGALLEGAAFRQGLYELAFSIGAYFDCTGASLPDPKFIDVVLIRFGVGDADGHYHVPLLVSPFGYSTYRGS